ncbi:MAG: helix-hairpin-helix domain-containing protein [Saprospiraceae bacterium]|nr:helix-hairpin-helix domain-containing protein [Saprospiraceae bacterium]
MPYSIALLHPTVSPVSSDLESARWQVHQENGGDTAGVGKIAKSDRQERAYRAGAFEHARGSQPDTLFPFDPNHLPAPDAKRLGLSNLVYSNLQKYLQAGGKIRSAEQFRKLYGMTEETWHDLEPFIKLPEDHKNVIFQRSAETLQANVNLQTASPKELMRELKLDYKLAYRLVNYRERLGGFAYIDQLKEVPGMSDSTMNELSGRIHLTGEVHRIHPNTATAEQLQAHPYIRYKQARCISEYRHKNGPTLTLDRLKNLYGPDTVTFRKVLNYLDFSTPAVNDSVKAPRLPGQLSQ